MRIMLGQHCWLHMHVHVHGGMLCKQLQCTFVATQSTVLHYTTSEGTKLQESVTWLNPLSTHSQSRSVLCQTIHGMCRNAFQLDLTMNE